MLDRPVLADRFESEPYALVRVQAELLVAGGDRVHDVVAVEEEDDGAERHHRDDGLPDLDEVGEDGGHDERVDGEEGDRERDRVEGGTPR